MRQRELGLILIRCNQLEQKIDRLLEISENAKNGGDNGANVNQNPPHDAQHVSG